MTTHLAFFNASDLGWSKQLKGYIRRFVQQESDVDDIYQDTCLKMMELNQKDHIHNSQSYAKRVAKSLIIDQSRSAFKQHEAMLEEPECKKSDLDTLIDYQQRLVIYQKILKDTPSTRRDVFVRYRIKGQSKEQICQEMGLSLEAVNKHITRMLTHLKAAIARELDK
ncbi:RNA polymerase sigma factor [Catenovulum sediminis]|uniref:Sigma-70 family RNA polymerase sigma factor n=1 Tax=Catenovulum sediminis TaxID=1740262 RepID=A0ABV1RJ13_9ALTE